MNRLFSVDGPLYKFCTVIFNLFILNILWIIFSIPLFSIGASTTALFFVTEKLMMEKKLESLNISKDFWKSFKQNFKQATIIWLIILCAFVMIIFNLQNIHMFSGLTKYLAVVQFVILLELVFVSIYVFALLARYHMKIIDIFKTAFFLSNRHFITTILCLAVIPGVYFLIAWREGFIMLAMSIYSCWTTYLLKNKFRKYEMN